MLECGDECECEKATGCAAMLRAVRLPARRLSIYAKRKARRTVNATRCVATTHDED